MWTSFLSRWLTRSGTAPRRSAPRRRRAFLCLSHRPRLEALEDRRLLSAGALDPTFGNGTGYVTTSPSNGGSGRAALSQPDGKILAAGIVYTSKAQEFGVVRYNTNGSLDTSFGSGGSAVADFSSYYGNKSSLSVLATVADAAALYPQAGTVNDGKIVLVGHGVIGSRTSDQGALLLARFNANGTLDTTFGNKGELVTTFSVAGDGLSRVVIQPDGKIVASMGNNTGFELARYNPNGTLDTTFGSGGEVTTSFGQGFGTNGLLLQPDGKLIVAGATYQANDWEMARYNPNGSLDATFGSGGAISGPFGNGIESGGAALYPTGSANAGKIIAVGLASDAPESGLVVGRYNPDGSPDTTFGTGGEVTTPTGAAPTGVAIAADGKLVVCGNYNGTQAVFRFNADSSVYSSFGAGGIVTTAVGVGGGSYFSVVLQSNGDIVTAGSATQSTKGGTIGVFAVARYLPSEPEVGSFTSSASTVTAGSSVTLTASNISDGNPGATVRQVAFYAQVNGSNTLLGYGTQTSPGVWTFSFTVNLAPGTYTLFAQATDSYGVLGDMAALTLTVQ
jgi:uncharacterized delta-60 repeat protein